MRIRGYRRALRLVDYATERVVIAAGAVMVVLVAAEVAGRYVFANSIFFANELSRLAFVWTIFLGMPLALSRGRHVGVNLLLFLLPRTPAREIFRFGCVASAILMALVVHQSVRLLIDNWDQNMMTVPWSAGLFALPIPIGAALSLAHLIDMSMDAGGALDTLLSAEPAE